MRDVQDEIQIIGTNHCTSHRLLPVGALLPVSVLNRIFTESSERPGKREAIFFHASPSFLCQLNIILSSGPV